MCILIILILLVLALVIFIETRKQGKREGLDIFGSLGKYRKAYMNCIDSCEMADSRDRLMLGNWDCTLVCNSLFNDLQMAGADPEDTPFQEALTPEQKVKIRCLQDCRFRDVTRNNPCSAGNPVEKEPTEQCVQACMTTRSQYL